MKVLMISIDRGLLGQGQLGDVVQRHQEYGRQVERLDIIVLCKKGYSEYAISENVRSYPTNSLAKIYYIKDALDIATELSAKNNYNLVITQEPFLAGWAGLKLKEKYHAKLLTHLHGDFIDNPSWLAENWKNRFLLMIGKRVIKKADGLRVMSQGIKEKLIRMGVLAGKVRVINTPVDINKFQQPDLNKISELKKKYGDKKIILFVGRLEKVKDLPTLLQAINIIQEKYPDLILVILGKGAEEEKLKTYNLQLKTKTEFIGQVSHQELVNYYHTSNMVVLSSLSESFGKVLVEANACGKPVVSTATTGAKEIIQDGYNGFLVPIKDAQALADKIIYLLNNPDAARQIGENGRKLVYEKFDGQKNTQRIIQFWNDLVK